MDQKRKETLICFERLKGCPSPDLWPEKVPGLTEFTKNTQSIGSAPRAPNKFRTDLDADDVRLVNELGLLSADQLMEYLKNLQNSAYQLGVDEAKQLARGRLLKIFEKSDAW